LSDDRSEPVDLTFIGRALQQLTSDVASLRDDMRVLTAIVLRHDREFERLNTKLDTCWNSFARWSPSTSVLQNASASSKNSADSST
jgi:hypothetical protein